MTRYSWCNPFFLEIQMISLSRIWVELNPLFGDILNGKHDIKRRSCSQTGSNHWYSELSYLGVSLGAVVMRPQKNISALWLCSDHQCEHGLQWLDRTVPFGKAWPCLVWRIERFLQLGEACHGRTVMSCPTVFLRNLWYNFFGLFRSAV